MSTDGARAARGGAQRIAAFGVGLPCRLAAVALVTRHLGVARYGEYATALGLVLVAAAVTGAGVAVLGVREWVQEDPGERERTLRALLGLRIALTTLGVVVAVVAGALAGFDGALLGGVALMGAGMVLSAIQATLVVPLQGELRLGTVAVLEAARPVLVAIGVAIVVALDGGVLPLLGVVLPAEALLLAITARYAGMRAPRFGRRAWAAVAKPALTVAVATAAGVLYLYAAQLALAIVAGDAEVGIFSASFRVFAVAATVPGVLASSALAVLADAAGDHGRLWGELRHQLRIQAAVGVALGAGLALGAPVVVDLIAGDGYDDAVPVLRIHAIALAFACLAAPMIIGLLATHRHRALVGVTAVALAVAAGGAAVAGDAEGAAAATVVAEALMAAGGALALRRRQVSAAASL